MADFGRAISGLLDREGGYVDDKDDAGGETNFGISKRAYPSMDIKGLTRSKASMIYLNDYWIPAGCCSIDPQNVASVLFDSAVNQGISTAVKLMQIELGVAVDGLNGPVTTAAINDHPDHLRLSALFTLRRISKYVSLAASRSSRKKFLAGWVSRAIVALME